MDENDPIWKAIDLGGGQTCDVAGVLRELLKAGYVICKSGNVEDSPQDRALEAVRSIAAAHGANDGETVERMVVRIAANMWVNAVRAEWEAYVATDPELIAQHAVALELMKEDGYGDVNPICMMPGQKAFIAKVDNQEAVCIDYCMGQVMPLSSIYVNRVRLVQSAAARVADRLAKEAAKQPAEWPITIASGETFNSIEEMEASPIDAVRELAVMMRDSEQYGQRSAPHIEAWQKFDRPLKTAGGEVFDSVEEMKASPNKFIRGLAEAMENGAEEREKVAANMFANFVPPQPPTCWGYFGFDGPTNFENLSSKYRETVNGITPAGEGNALLAAEVHRQYQNCLRELAAASGIMSTPATSAETAEDE